MFFKKEKLENDEKIIIGMSFIFRILLIYAFALGIWYNHWITMFISLAALLLTFLPSMIAHNYKIRLPSEFVLVITIFIYLTLILGETKEYYLKYWWWDNLLHTFAGISFGFIGFLIVFSLFKAGKINTKPIFLILFAFCFALSIGVLWEIFEFNMDNIVHTNMQRHETGIFDTMNDLIEDTLGALFTSLIGYFYLRGVKGSGIFHGLVVKFVNHNPHLFKNKKEPSIKP